MIWQIKFEENAMKKFMYFIFIIIFLILSGCAEPDQMPADLKEEYPESLAFSVRNPGDLNRIDASVFLQVSDLEKHKPAFNPRAFLIWSGENEIPGQTIDDNGDGEFNSIIFNFDLIAHKQKKLTIRFNPDGESTRKYKKRTQAELSHKIGGEFVDRKYVGGTFKSVSYLKLPPEHTDHSEFIRYEGPGWESDKVGFRFYLDWRNAIDIFGKKVPDMVLQNVGLDGFESYHNPADWGMDILKVGESLGVGSIAIWEDGKANRVAVTDSVDCAIVANGPLYSQVRTRYFGWKVGSGAYNLVSNLSITAGSRITKNQLKITGDANNLCSGLAKHENTEYLQSDPAQGGWAYIAIYGQQSLAGDKLGTAVFYNTDDLIEISEDELNYVVVLKPYQNQIIYYFLAAWEQEPEGIKSIEEFKNYLNETIRSMDTPLEIIY